MRSLQSAKWKTLRPLEIVDCKMQSVKWITIRLFEKLKVLFLSVEISMGVNNWRWCGRISHEGHERREKTGWNAE